MQQLSFSIRQTGEQIADIPVMSKLHSSNACLRPFASPAPVIMICGFLWNLAQGLFIEIIIAFCFLCFPPFDLFMSNAWSASSPSKACANDWSKMNRALHPRCASSKIVIALSTWTSNWVCSHHRSLLTPGYIMVWASLIMLPSLLWMISHLFSSSIKSETWMMQLRPFFWRICLSH